MRVQSLPGVSVAGGNKLVWWLFAGQALFFCNYMLVDSTALVRAAALLGMALPWLVMMVTRGGAGELFNQRPVQCLLLFLAYVTLSLTWAGGLETGEAGSVLRKLVIYGTAMLATISLYRERPDLLPLMFKVIASCSLAAALAAVIADPGAFFGRERLTGLGGLTNELDAGIAFGVGSLLWLHLWRSERHWLYLLLSAITLLAMFSTLSRSVVVAWLVGLFVYRLATKRGRVTVELAIGLGLAALLLGATWMLREAGTIKDSCRVELFGTAWQQFLQHPLFGQGIERFARITACHREFNGSHNLILEALRYTGVVGVGLLLLLLWSIATSCRHMANRAAAAPLLMMAGFGWTMMMVNGQFIAIGPRLPWLVVWLPLMALVGLSLAQAREVHEENRP